MSKKENNLSEMLAEQVSMQVKQGQWADSEESYELLHLKIEELKQSLQQKSNVKRWKQL